MLLNENPVQGCGGGPGQGYRPWGSIPSLSPPGRDLHWVDSFSRASVFSTAK